LPVAVAVLDFGLFKLRPLELDFEGPAFGAGPFLYQTAELRLQILSLIAHDAGSLSRDRRLVIAACWLRRLQRSFALTPVDAAFQQGRGGIKIYG
jgi:hypothetical protein